MEYNKIKTAIFFRKWNCKQFFILLFFHNKDILFLWFEEKKILLPFFATISDFPYTQKFFSSKHFENNVIDTTLFLILTSVISYLRLEMYCYM